MSYFSESARKCSLEPNHVNPSPSQYNPNQLGKPSAAIVPFGSTVKSSRLNQEKKQPEFINSHTYVQTYDHYQNIVHKAFAFLPQKKTSCSIFLSKTERFKETVQNSPGPGNYSLSPEKIVKAKSKHNLKRAGDLCRSLTSSRLKAPSIPNDHLGYREDRDNLMKKVKINYNQSPYPGLYEMKSSFGKLSGLKWKQNQTKQKKTFSGPGPGSYQFKMLTFNQKNVLSPFKSLSKRFSDKGSNSLYQPGPGQYNPDKVTKKSYSHQREGNFTSKTARFPEKKECISTGPGCYYNSVKQRVKAKSVSTLKTISKVNQKPQQVVKKKTIFEQKNDNPGPAQYASLGGMSFEIRKQMLRRYKNSTLPQEKRIVFQEVEKKNKSRA